MIIERETTMTTMTQQYSIISVIIAFDLDIHFTTTSMVTDYW